jgi:hypothetical protein
MDCGEIEELLYDFTTGRLPKEEARRIEDHLVGCKGCQGTRDELQKTLSLLDQWKTPELSPDFQARVMKEVARRFPEKQPSIFQRWIEKFFRPIPIGGLAVAAGALLTLTFLLKGHEAEKPEMVTRDFELSSTVSPAKSPIIIETKDVTAALTQLTQIIQSHKGKLVRKRPLDSAVEVVFWLPSSEEKNLFEKLYGIGITSISKEGYKDSEGNITVLLRLQ